MSAWTHFPSLSSIAGGALIASPNRSFREQVLGRLNGRCRPVQQALGGADALAKLAEGDWPLLFLDRRMPDLESDELVAIIAQRFPGIQVVLLDSASADCAESEESEEREERAPGSEPSPLASGPQRLVQEDCDAKKAGEIAAAASLPGMIGQSPAMLHVYRLARLVAPRMTTVLIAGATGSGKELVARALHTLSPRSGKAFVAVNCAAIPEALLESELFGHARGAFTGAVQAQLGRIPAAHGGTLFLDEVSELPLGMQAKLLRFLEQKEIQRLGTAELSRVDVRVVAASNVDLAARTGRGEFREDLFYRLSAFPLELPPLTERREDIVPLAEHFLACMAAAVGGIYPVLSGAAIAILEGHAWRGNVRELQHVMERASILVENGPTILSEHLYFPFQTRATGSRNLSCSSLAS
ncbi:MAG: sigma-54 dependent transcriptional regulator [Candidatus Sulfotelmatobacter sp.]